MRVESHTIEVRELRPADAVVLAALLGAASADYVADFFPFSFQEGAIRRMLQRAELDRYWGMIVDHFVVGFCMLRGFDAGYSRPSFGVFVEQRWAGRGLGGLGLAYALAWCRCNGVSAVMLKVAPGNTSAVKVYERAGFVPGGTCKVTGQRVYEWRCGTRLVWRPGSVERIPGPCS
jgi:RimJ/RimL family protein N-acetyltransferase